MGHREDRRLPPEADIKLNTEFFENKLSPQAIQQLVALWQADGISQETLYYNLERGGVTRPGVDFEEEKALIPAGPL